MSTGAVSFKIVLIGEGNVGKTAIRQRYLGEGFGGKYQMTIGADFAVKRIEFQGTMYVIQIWDLAGQSGFLNTRKLYYGGAMAALLVFDITRPATFQKCDNWIREVQDNRGELIPIILIGNKSDLRTGADTEVSIAEAKKYAKELRSRLGFPVIYIETSAKEGKNIEYAFETIIEHIQKSLSGEEWEFPVDDDEFADETSDEVVEEAIGITTEEDQVAEEFENKFPKAPVPELTQSDDKQLTTPEEGEFMEQDTSQESSIGESEDETVATEIIEFEEVEEIPVEEKLEEITEESSIEVIKSAEQEPKNHNGQFSSLQKKMYGPKKGKYRKTAKSKRTSSRYSRRRYKY